MSRMTTEAEKLTDPYGCLEYAVGSGDDFWCFDFHVDHDRKRVRLHAVVNSETGSFIQDAETPQWWSYEEAVNEAVRLVYAAQDWCAAGYGEVAGVRHSVKGWNQDAMYFARAVEHAVRSAQGQRNLRLARKSGKLPVTAAAAGSER